MEPRFVVIDFIKIGADIRYRVIDTTDPNPANKHGVYDEKREAEAVCKALNAQHPD